MKASLRNTFIIMTDFNKTLRIIGRHAGFFSNVLHMVDNLQYADRNGFKPGIDVDNDGRFPYSDKRPNIWNHYFKPINDGVEVGEVVTSNIFSTISPIIQSPFNTNLNDFVLGFDGRSMLWNFKQRNDLEMERFNRQEIGKIVEKYIHLSDDMESIVNDFHSKNFAEKTLGIHVRGTDYQFHDFMSYVNAINKHKDNYDRIYLATDNNETISRMRELYGDKICYYETQIRANNFVDTVVVFDGRLIKNDQDKVKHGEDVLIEASLLSKCNHIICINSNVPLASLYLNPNSTFELLGRTGIGG